MKTRVSQLLLTVCLTASIIGVATSAYAATKQTVVLVAADGSNAAGTVVVSSENGHTDLTLSLTGLAPNTAHSFWQKFDTTMPPFVTDAVLGLSVMTDANLGTLAPVLPVTPAAADNSGFKAGTDLDPNGFVSDAKGNASFKIRLNYVITDSAIAPVVLAPLTQTVQVVPVIGLGECTASSGSAYLSSVDSAYARKYDTSQSNPSFQRKDKDYKAALIRGTVASFVIVEHLDGITHGHTPGVMTAVSGCGDEFSKLTGVLVR